MYTNYDFGNKNKWVELRSIVKEYNNYAVKNGRLSIKITSFGKIITDIKNIFDKIFKYVPDHQVNDFLNEENFPKRIYEVYKNIREEEKESFFKINRCVASKVFDIKETMAAKVYMAYKYCSQDNETQYKREGETMVGVSKIAKMVNRSESHVRKVLAKLIDAGVIENDFKQGSRKVIRIVK